jgi:hypothetical protein
MALLQQFWEAFHSDQNFVALSLMQEPATNWIDHALIWSCYFEIAWNTP